MLPRRGGKVEDIVEVAVAATKGV